jgi:hypothetical protein
MPPLLLLLPLFTIVLLAATRVAADFMLDA